MTVHDAIEVYSNANQIEFFAWLEIVILCLVRLLYLPRLIAKGIITIEVKLRDRRAVLACMILLGSGSLLGRYVPAQFGVTAWEALAFTLAGVAAVLRTTAVYLYIRTITHERDGEVLWGLMLGGALVFAIVMRDK